MDGECTGAASHTMDVCICVCTDQGTAVVYHGYSFTEGDERDVCCWEEEGLA
jgi:hypothetical protein